MFRVAYLKNPDPVFFSDLDVRLQQCLTNLAIKVQEVELDQIHIEWDSNAITFYHKGEQLHFDGLLNWGYMSPKHMHDYEYLIQAVEAANKVTLHSTRADKILQSKLLQGLAFSKAGVPIPKSITAFSVQSIKTAVNKNFLENEPAVVKLLDGYGGDGVMLARCSDEAISLACKEVWKNHHTVVQKFVPDSLGKSVRALCMNGQLVAVCQYNDQGSDFRSNNGYHESFKLLSLMDQKEKYEKIALDAVNSIAPNLAVGGVDILDSQQYGLQVLEVNGWPDLWDTEKASGIDTFQRAAESFLKRLERHRNEQKQ